MFTWYQNAEYCIAYLRDVYGSSAIEFYRSTWFSRGWTLQELLAPRTVLFYNHDWNIVGAKGTVDAKSQLRIRNLHQHIARITNISDEVLCDVNAAKALEIETKLAWASDRQTTKPEDRAYSLLGIFGVYMSPIYGEGYRNAYRRLLREVRDRSDDIHDDRRERSSKSADDPPSIVDTFYLRINTIPSREFKWKDDTNRYYTVVLRNNFFTQIFVDGDIGLEIASHSLDFREHVMRAMWREHCRVLEWHKADNVRTVTRNVLDLQVNRETMGRTKSGQSETAQATDAVPTVLAIRTAAVLRDEPSPHRNNYTPFIDGPKMVPRRAKKSGKLSRFFSKSKVSRSNISAGATDLDSEPWKGDCADRGPLLSASKLFNSSEASSEVAVEH